VILLISASEVARVTSVIAQLGSWVNFVKEINLCLGSFLFACEVQSVQYDLLKRPHSIFFSKVLPLLLCQRSVNYVHGVYFQAFCLVPFVCWSVLLPVQLSWLLYAVVESGSWVQVCHLILHWIVCVFSLSKSTLQLVYRCPQNNLPGLFLELRWIYRLRWEQTTSGLYWVYTFMNVECVHIYKYICIYFPRLVVLGTELRALCLLGHNRQPFLFSLFIR
jgi:hypothetical protein